MKGLLVMKKTTKLFRTVLSLAAALSAMAATGISVNACHFWFAQPKVPQNLNKFMSEKK